MIWKVKDEDIRMRRPRGATHNSLSDGNIATRTPPAKRKFTRAVRTDYITQIELIYETSVI